MVKIIWLFWFKFKILSFVIAFFFIIKSGSAQYVKSDEFIVKNSIYLEAGGNGLWFSLNYDRILRQKEKVILTRRTGFSYRSYCNSITLPITFSFLYGNNNNFLEIGAGPTLQYISSSSTTGFSTHGIIGFRYQEMEKSGFMFRVVLTPIFWRYIDDNIYRTGYYEPWLGISFGYSF
jgi:hypothetical protein